jgi:uncharacterized protein YjbJ (UPF0337 family)
MSNTSNRVAGAAEELKGTVKKGVGQATGNERMEAEGKAEELVGGAKQEAAKASERTKGAVEQVVGAAKSHAGSVLGNDHMQTDGKTTELKGEARQKLNQ